MSAQLRPDRVGAILMEDPDSDEYRAVCDPAKPLAWRTPLVFQHLVAMAKSGRIVVAKAGLKAWRIRANGRMGALRLNGAPLGGKAAQQSISKGALIGEAFTGA